MTAVERTPEPARSERVNVLLVASSLWIGGAEVVIQHLAEGLDRGTFNVTVCYLKDRGSIGEELARAGVDVVGVSRRDRTRTDYLTSLKLAKVIRAKRIQVVHTHTPDGIADAGMCRLLMPWVKLVHTFHFGNYPHARRETLMLERIFSRFATQLFSVGDVQQRQIRSVHRLRDGAIRTVWNGVRLRPAADERSAAFRRSLQPGDRIVVGTVATFIRQKGLDDLLEIARLVRDSGANALFVVVGEGPLRAELEERRRALGVERTVVFTGWLANAAEVALPAFDVFLQPSLWEAMSMVLLEAMAASRAVIATSVGEAPHVIDDGVSGMLVQPRDVAGMASAVQRLIADPALRSRLGAAARQTVEGRFTVERMTRSYEQAYLEALGRSPLDSTRPR